MITDEDGSEVKFVQTEKRRKLASIQKIVDIRPIPDADFIEIVKVLGWTLVSKKGTFAVGDLCVYFEIDSILPQEEWCDFLQDAHRPDKPRRLKTKKMRKQISQGLALPIEDLAKYHACMAPEVTHDGIKSSFQEGDDVTELLGIEKWEPQLSINLAGFAKGNFPSLISKTDEDRVQSNPRLIEEFQGRLVHPTVKIDGTSGTFLNAGDETEVCSRNLSLKDVDGNVYWDMYRKYEMEELFAKFPNTGIQGEICGPGIQKNKMGYDEVQLRVFNVYDVGNTRWLDPVEMFEFCSENGLITVPYLQSMVFDFKDIEEMLEFAKGTYPNGYPREGVVWRPFKGFYSEVLRGRASFKVINNDFLLKSKE